MLFTWFDFWGLGGHYDMSLNFHSRELNIIRGNMILKFQPDPIICNDSTKTKNVLHS